MNKSNLIRTGYWLGVIGVIQFIVLTIIAMIIYPGGYSFSHNFFSSLGMVNSANNHMLNTASRIIFIIACTITAVMNIPFSLALRTNLKDAKPEKTIGWIGTILSIGSSPFLSLLSIYPADVHGYGHLHLQMTRIFFMLFGLAVVIYTIACFINKRYNKAIASYGVLVAIFALVYINVFMFNAVFQKFTIYLMILWVIVQGVYLLKKVNRSTPY
jgi:hypothetical membrane protein